MKKIIVLSIILFLLTVNSVSAVKQFTNPNSNQNKNKIATQNEGEEQQLEVSIQQESETGSSSADSKRQDIDKHLNGVSEQVHQLLQSRAANTGIGKQVREIAQNQEKAQEKIKNSYNKLNSRSKLFSFLFGPDFETIESLDSQLGENQKRIEKLVELKAKIVSQTDSQELQEAIDSMTDQNTALEEVVGLESKKVNLFGWVKKLFK